MREEGSREGDPKSGAKNQASRPELVSGTKGHTDKTHSVENRLDFPAFGENRCSSKGHVAR